MFRKNKTLITALLFGSILCFSTIKTQEPDYLVGIASLILFWVPGTCLATTTFCSYLDTGYRCPTITLSNFQKSLDRLAYLERRVTEIEAFINKQHFTENDLNALRLYHNSFIVHESWWYRIFEGNNIIIPPLLLLASELKDYKKQLEKELTLLRCEHSTAKEGAELNCAQCNNLRNRINDILQKCKYSQICLRSSLAFEEQHNTWLQQKNNRNMTRALIALTYVIIGHFSLKQAYLVP